MSDEPVSEKVCGLRQEAVINALGAIQDTQATQSKAIAEITLELCSKPGSDKLPLKEEVHRNTWWRHWHQRIWYLVVATVIVSLVGWGIKRWTAGPPKLPPAANVHSP